MGRGIWECKWADGPNERQHKLPWPLMPLIPFSSPFPFSLVKKKLKRISHSKSFKLAKIISFGQCQPILWPILNIFPCSPFFMPSFCPSKNIVFQWSQPICIWIWPIFPQNALFIRTKFVHPSIPSKFIPFPSFRIFTFYSLHSAFGPNTFSNAVALFPLLLHSSPFCHIFWRRIKSNFPPIASLENEFLSASIQKT